MERGCDGGRVIVPYLIRRIMAQKKTKPSNLGKASLIIRPSEIAAEGAAPCESICVECRAFSAHDVETPDSGLTRVSNG